MTWRTLYKQERNSNGLAVLRLVTILRRSHSSKETRCARSISKREGEKSEGSNGGWRRLKCTIMSGDIKVAYGAFGRSGNQAKEIIKQKHCEAGSLQDEVMTRPLES